MEYLVVTVTNNLEEYPEYKEDTEKFPELIEEIEDEIETFILCENRVYKAEEFFYQVDIKSFTTEE